MPKRSIVVATDNKKTAQFFSDYFDDTVSTPSFIRTKPNLSALFSLKPDFVFLQGEWLDSRISKRLGELKKENPKMKCFSLGYVGDSIDWCAKIEVPIEEKQFRKQLFEHVEFPDPVKLLAVDDEAEILEIVQDYFEVRKNPSFQIRTTFNGLEGFKLIKQEVPHCMILDLKMPVRSGVELYRDLMRAGYRIPTVIFIDSTTADDILEIRKWGTPVFSEKGGPLSSMPDMLALVKKLVAFS